MVGVWACGRGWVGGYVRECGYRPECVGAGVSCHVVSSMCVGVVVVVGVGVVVRRV